MLDPKTLNIKHPDAKKTIWDPQSEFMRELEIQRLKSGINYKKKRPNIMQAQIGMLQDMCAEPEKKMLYVPDSKGGFV